jgi:hypothetical protein
MGADLVDVRLRTDELLVTFMGICIRRSCKDDKRGIHGLRYIS